MSWQGRRGKGKGVVMIRCRLDRALANEDWHTFFLCSYTEYLGMVGSDHRPVVAFMEDKVPKRRGQLNFDKRLGKKAFWNPFLLAGRNITNDNQGI